MNKSHWLAAAALVLCGWAQAQTPTSTALTSSVNPSTAGQAVTFTATVTGSSPTGTVTFKDGATILTAKQLAAGPATHAVKLTGGSHSMTAVYAGDANNLTSTSSAVSQSVDTAATSVTFTVTPASATVGQNVTLSARINGGYNVAGTVTFSNGGSTLGIATVTAGVATLSVNTLAQGSHTLGAAYAGDTSNTASTGSGVSVSVSSRPAMTWQYGYDALGRPNTVVDGNSLATYTYYDTVGRPIQTQQPANTGSGSPTVIQYGWNEADGLASVADPRNLSTTYSRNALGKVTSQSSPDTGSTTYSYDGKGNVTASATALASEEWFYIDLSRPAGSQIILSPSHFSGHRKYEASVCSQESEFLCYDAKGFQFAIPKRHPPEGKWVHRGAHYEASRSETFGLLGTKVDAIWIGQRVGTKRMWFLFSRQNGLLAFASEKPPGPLFVVQNECGFGASPTCGSTSPMKSSR